jgi:outer membrane murein-binding lipoprotein Lpp
LFQAKYFMRIREWDVCQASIGGISMMQKRMILPISVAMAVSLGSWATPGSAQTIDELKAQIQEMSTRLEELETKQEQLEKKTDETSVDSRTVISGKKGVKLTVSGQVNRGVLYADIFAVQRYDKIGTDFYFGARNHELDRPASNFDDVVAVLVGAKVRF